MNYANQLELRGCAPEPLMSYLKALGIFRLVAEQKDPAARAWWKNDTFFLRSMLDRAALKTFFLEEYRPTPIVSPWNSSSSITSRSESKNLDESVMSLESPRFRRWNKVVSLSRRIYDQSQEIPNSKRKEWVLAQCRVRFPDDALDWLDATYVLTSDGAKYPPLLGTGGNDGRLEFSRNYLQNVVLALNLKNRRNGAEIIGDQISAALFDEGSPRLEKRTNGFFNPGSVGGANATVGFSGDALTNPWDYVLMFEGALLFAGAAARRLSPQTSTKAVFPFTVDNSAGGYGTSADSEYGDSSRAEFWVPVWNSPAGFGELTHLVSEGRAQVGKRQAATGSDFARVVAGLGAERGISQFHRYGFLVRNGLAYLAAPLGRYHIKPDDKGIAESANLLFDLDGWLDNLRRNARGNSAPAGLRTSLSQIERAIIDFCQRGGARDLQNVLIAVGRADRWLAKSSLSRSVQPLNKLSWDWVQHARDDSHEFRLALALASILQGRVGNQVRVGAVRENLEPVDAQLRTRWNENSKSFVWNAGDPLANMMSVLIRRCMEIQMTGLNDANESNAQSRQHPLDSTYSARLDDIVAFIDGNVDYQRIADLALPLSFIRYRPRQNGDDGKTFNPPYNLPAAYAAMKLTLLPRRLDSREFGDAVRIPMVPNMLPLLRAGRVGAAYTVAHRRLVASGLRPLVETPGISDNSEIGRRLAASLLFPIDVRTTRSLARRPLRPTNESSYHGDSESQSTD